MDEINWLAAIEQDSEEATLLIAFQGWSDAAEAATRAVNHIRSQIRARKIATIDSDGFFDFTVTRPQIKLGPSGVRRITWPDTRFYFSSKTQNPRLLITLGTEPQLRWKAFAKSVAKIAESYKVTKVITVGALLSEVPHTRPVRVVGTTSDELLAEDLGIERSKYSGPTGILGVLQTAFEARGVSCISLWANVPHYVAQTPSPKAALALVRRITSILGIEVDTQKLESDSVEYTSQIDEIVYADEEIRAYVEQLESSEDALDDDSQGLSFASADELAVEAENFLRRHMEGE